MRFSSRFFLYGPFLLFVALAVGVMSYWWIAATDLSARLDRENGHEIVPGVRMHFAAKRIAGFPFRLDAIFTDLTLEIAGPSGPYRWHAAQFASHALTYAPSVTVMEAAGTQEVSWTGSTGKRRTFTFTPALLHASAVMEGTKLVRFDLDSIDLNSPRFAAARAQFHMRRDPAADALDLIVDLQSLRFAGDAAAGFPDGFSHARFEGRLAPAKPFVPALDGRAQWQDAIGEWRKESGAFKVDEAALFWAKCQATSSGNLALDDAHRLHGSLDVSLADCDALAKQAQSVTASPKTHRAVLKVLADLAAQEAPDKSGALPITVVFKDGLAYVGPGKATANGYFEPIGFLHPLY